MQMQLKLHKLRSREDTRRETSRNRRSKEHVFVSYHDLAGEASPPSLFTFFFLQRNLLPIYAPAAVSTTLQQCEHEYTYVTCNASERESERALLNKDNACEPLPAMLQELIYMSEDTETGRETGRGWRGLHITGVPQAPSLPGAVAGGVCAVPRRRRHGYA